MKRLRENLEPRLSACYLAAALFTVAAAIVALGKQSTEPLGEIGLAFRSATWLAQSAGVIYLIATAAVHMRRSLKLKRGYSADDRPLLWAGHALVLLVALFCILRGPGSRVLLAGLDRLVAAVAVVSLLSCILAVLSWWAASRGSVQGSDEPDSSSWGRFAYALVFLAGLAASASLAYFELLPLPGTVVG